MPDIDRLVAEGRLVAARARASTELSDAWRVVVMPSEEPWHQRFVALIQAAVRLSDLGDYDVAATYVAPFLDSRARQERLGAPCAAVAPGSAHSQDLARGCW